MHSTKRYREIAVALARHGFAWLWTEYGIGSVLGGFEHHHHAHTADSAHTQAERLRLTLEELGTTFIKAGQVLSTRPDLISADYVAELTKLQDHAPVVAFDEIAAVIQSEFGGRPDEMFATFDVEPRAAGSIAQVHGATLADGTLVVVKVRLPGIEQLVEEDLAILGQVARFLAHTTELGKRLDIEALADEFAFTLRNELDFTREGHNAERIAAEFADDDGLHVPRIFWERTTHRVLTMEDIHGIKIDDLAALDAAGMDRRALAQRCAHIALVQVLDYGFFHADPHPGNFFVEPGGVVALIDYGMVGRLEDRLRQSLVRLGLAVSRHDSERLIDELLVLGATQGPVDRKSLQRDLDRLLEKYDGVPIGRISAAAVFREVAETVLRHGLKLPSDLILLIRVVAMDEGLGASLDPDFNLMEFGQPYFKRFWRKRYSPRAMAGRVREGTADLLDISAEVPHRLIRLMGQVERGELAVRAHLDVQEPLTKNLEHAANRIAISVLAAGLIVALSVMALVYGPAGSAGFGAFLIKAALGLGFICGAWLLVSLWKSMRR